MAEIKEMLDEVIQTELQNLNTIRSGDQDKSKAIDNIAVLYKLRIEEAKTEADAEDKRERRLMEQDAHDYDEQIKRHQIKAESIDRYMKLGIAAAELTVPLIFYGVWMRKGFKFEETGTYTSKTFMNLFNRFKPTRKS